MEIRLRLLNGTIQSFFIWICSRIIASGTFYMGLPESVLSGGCLLFRNYETALSGYTVGKTAVIINYA
jgi:hypothetical protein